MTFSSLLTSLDKVSKPGQPGYHPTQLTLVAGLSYLSTACFTKVHPIRGMALAASTYIVSQFVTPYFTEFFQPYKDIPLAPLIGQIMHLTSSIAIAKIICHIARVSLSFGEARQVGAAFIFSLLVIRCVQNFWKYLPSITNKNSTLSNRT